MQRSNGRHDVIGMDETKGIRIVDKEDGANCVVHGTKVL